MPDILLKELRAELAALKAENEWQPIETAEACAKYIDSTNGNIRGVNTVFSKALRSGAWKEFKK